jgi:hypothetical protein
LDEARENPHKCGDEEGLNVSCFESSRFRTPNTLQRLRGRHDLSIQGGYHRSFCRAAVIDKNQHGNEKMNVTATASTKLFGLGARI